MSILSIYGLSGGNPPLLIGRDRVARDFEKGLDNGVGAPGRIMLITGARLDTLRRWGVWVLAGCRPPGARRRILPCMVKLGAKCPGAQGRVAKMGAKCPGIWGADGHKRS